MSKNLLLNLSSEYPLACDAIWYFIYGERTDSLMESIFNEKYVKTGSGEDKYIVISKLMLDYEYCWEEYLEEIETQLIDIIGNDPNL